MLSEFTRLNAEPMQIISERSVWLVFRRFCHQKRPLSAQDKILYLVGLVNPIYSLRVSLFLVHFFPSLVVGIKRVCAARLFALTAPPSADNPLCTATKEKNELNKKYDYCIVKASK